MALKAEIITIGDEILFGQTLDTNSHWISGELDQLGIRIIRKVTIPDERQVILDSFAIAASRADLILITGGLGPTNDDLTKPCLAEYFGVDMSINEEALNELTEMFARSGRELTELNRAQALQPIGAQKITNKLGTAPGIWMEKDHTIFISMPGVPFEMKGMMTDYILPELKRRYVKKELLHKIVRTVGIPESMLAAKLESWESMLPEHIKLAYLPSLGQVKLRLTADGNDIRMLEKEIDEQIEKCLPLIEKYVYGYGNTDLEEVVGEMLRKREFTLACAESCTGGYLSHLLTSIPGSSAYFKGSYVTYANEVKSAALDIDPELIKQKGAVSEEVVSAMAENIRKKLGTTYGVGISGVAGPGGGTEEKPVGMVWIAVSDEQNTWAKQLVFTKTRKLNIQLSAVVALNMIRRKMIDC